MCQRVIETPPINICSNSTEVLVITENSEVSIQELTPSETVDTRFVPMMRKIKSPIRNLRMGKWFQVFEVGTLIPEKCYVKDQEKFCQLEKFSCKEKYFLADQDSR